MDFIIENIRLKELVLIVNGNKNFYFDFLTFLREKEYNNIYEFIMESDENRATNCIKDYLDYKSDAYLYDGLFRPFKNAKARWYFLSWILRDAPAQRLSPLIKHMPGNTSIEKKTFLLNELRKFIQPLFPNPENWEWSPLSEILLARLEGSRRALKGNLFEAIVRRSLIDFFEKYNLDLKIGEKEIRIKDETYDVQIYGLNDTVLMPVKTRETMGGGHALLFTRDIHKSISVAEENGYRCIPIVIAESWGGNLDDLACEKHIYIRANPNQVSMIEPMLFEKLEELLDIFKQLS